jgi:ATP-dependent Lon protease
VASFKLTGEAKEQVEQELDKFASTDPNSSEYAVTATGWTWSAPCPGFRRNPRTWT